MTRCARDRSEDVILLAQFGEARVRPGQPIRSWGLLLEHVEYRRRVGVGERFQKHGVNDAENCRVRADAQGQREHGNGRKTGRPPQHANGEAQILPTGLEESFPRGGADFFFRDFKAAPFQPDSAMCFFAVHTPCHLFFRGHFQEAVQLFVQFLVGLSFSEQ